MEAFTEILHCFIALEITHEPFLINQDNNFVMWYSINHTINDDVVRVIIYLDAFK